MLALKTAQNKGVPEVKATRRIMVPLDGSKTAEYALHCLETIVKESDNYEIQLVRVVEPIVMLHGEGITMTSSEQTDLVEAQEKVSAEKYLEQIVDRLNRVGIKAKPHVIYGLAAQTLADFTINNCVDQVVIAFRERSNLSRWIFGSVAYSLLRSISIPVTMMTTPRV